MSTAEPNRVFLAAGRNAALTESLTRFLEARGLDVVSPASDPGATIQEAVVNALTTADVVIADLTGSNPNVYFELGIARARNIPTILVMDNRDDAKLPFDVAGAPVIFYDDKTLSAAESSVAKAVDRLVGSPNE